MLANASVSCGRLRKWCPSPWKAEAVLKALAALGIADHLCITDNWEGFQRRAVSIGLETRGTHATMSTTNARRAWGSLHGCMLGGKRKGLLVLTHRRRALSPSRLLGWALLSLGLGLSGLAHAAPKAEIWERWQQHDPASQQRLDFTPWSAFLQTYVEARHPSGIARLRYASVTPADRQALRQWLNTLQAVPISTYNRREQQAYWMNLYNALTVSVVLEHYPVASIRDIRLGGGLFSAGPWQAKLATIEGEAVSLDDIEHRILRPIWRDNRLHYALNCASLGCPNLASTAYTPDTMEPMLEAGARAYVNHPRGVTCAAGVCTVSSIYIWFQDDFGGDAAGVHQHLLRYAEAPLAEQLKAQRGKFAHEYSWQLNAP